MPYNPFQFHLTGQRVAEVFLPSRIWNSVPWLLLFGCFFFCYCVAVFVALCCCFLNLFRIVNSIILTFYCIFITFCDIIKCFYEFSLSLFAALELFLFSFFWIVHFGCVFRCSSSERVESSWVGLVLGFVWIWWMHLFSIAFDGD